MAAAGRSHCRSSASPSTSTGNCYVLMGHIFFLDELETRQNLSPNRYRIEQRKILWVCVCLCAQAVLSIVELGELSDGRSVRGLAAAAAAAAADAVAGSSHLSTAQLLSFCLFYWGYWLVCSCNPSFAQRAPTHGPPLSVNTSKTRKMPVSDTEAVHTIAATEAEYER